MLRRNGRGEEIAVSRYLNATADFPRLLSHDYKPICVWCGRELRSGRFKYCSPECSDEVGLRCGFGIRSKLHDRDKGVCSRCRRDCTALKKALRVLRDRGLAGGSYHKGWLAKKEVDAHLAAALGVSPAEIKKSLWEAHHKKAVRDGGGACGLDNYETVCLWCHKKETASQAAEAAKQRA